MRRTSNGTKSGSVFRDVYYRSQYGDEVQRNRLLNSAKDSLDYVQRLAQSSVLKVHNGCVNTVFWNKSGQLLLSGSDDIHFVLTDPFSGKVQVRHKSLHRANIFSAKFLPGGNDRRIISCSGDGMVAFTDLSSPEEIQADYFNCHGSTTSYEVMSVPNEPDIFMSCGEDATVRLYDLRKESKCHKSKCKENVLISSPAAVTTMDVAPISMFYLAIGSSDGFVRVYDRRFLGVVDFEEGVDTKFTVPVKAFSIPAVEKRAYRITSVGYSADESEILTSYSSEHLYLFDATQEGLSTKASLMEKNKRNAKKPGNLDSPPPVRRLRLRGDWTDTGPESRPSMETQEANNTNDGRSPSAVMSRMTEVLSRMLSDSNRGHELPHEHDIDIVNTLQNLADDRSHDEDDTNEHEMEAESSNPQENFEKSDLDYSFIKQKYTGHRNSRTMIKESSFYGNNYVMSGSDCGHIFVWNKQTARLVNVLQGDKHVVNCIQPHPTLNIVATSGIDYDIKIWTPTDEQSNFDETAAEELMKRNDVMLRETRDTITVPASFMILLLSSLSRNRPAASNATPRYQNLIQNLRQRNRNRRAAASASANEPQTQESSGISEDDETDTAENPEAE
ncbi:DDB1- and CUL4-associated factor 6-like [Culicoides brevitarsis]|uniref:DDB1- and CUL4-associated factor 6-like n=1 Tax=Culicoides brevitarsis TaxID=469753 RepID=UPI00307C4380